MEGTLGSGFQVISEEEKFGYNLSTDMAAYANTHFETYVKEADLKQQTLMKNPVPDNLDQAKKLDDFIRDILKDKHNQKDLDMRAYIEKTVLLLDQTNNYITYFRRYNILAALNSPAQVQRNVEGGGRFADAT